MSKNIVDSVIEINSEKLGLLPTRRQIDYNGGYVNEWNTKSFTDYVKIKSNRGCAKPTNTRINQQK